MIRIVRIIGHSMEPVFSENDILLISNFSYWFRKPRVGEIVVFRKDNKLFCKRVTGASGARYYVSGDNSQDSFDSRKFGKIKFSDLVGKVIFKTSLSPSGDISPRQGRITM